MGRPNFSIGNVINPFDGLQNTVGSVADTYFKHMKLAEDAKANALAAEESDRRWQLQNARAEETLGYKRADQAREANNRAIVQNYKVKADNDTVDRAALEGYSGSVGDYLASLPKKTLAGGGTVPDVGPSIGNRVQGGMDNLMLEGKVESDVYNDVLRSTGDSTLASKVARNTAEPFLSREEILSKEVARVAARNKQLEESKKVIKFNTDQKWKKLNYSKGGKPKSSGTKINGTLELNEKIKQIPVSLFNGPWSDNLVLQELAHAAVKNGDATPDEAYAAVSLMVDPDVFGNNLTSSWGGDADVDFAKMLVNVKGGKRGSAEDIITAKDQKIMNMTAFVPRSFEQIRADMGAREGTNLFGVNNNTNVSNVPDRGKALGDSLKTTPVITPEQTDTLDNLSDNDLHNSLFFSESSGNPNAVSKTGAFGLSQAILSTAKDPGYGVAPLARDADPEEQMRFGIEYLSAMEKEFGNRSDAIMAYNMGPGAMKTWIKNGRKPTEESAEARNFLNMVVNNVGKMDVIGKFRNKRAAVANTEQPYASALRRSLLPPDTIENLRSNPRRTREQSNKLEELIRQRNSQKYYDNGPGVLRRFLGLDDPKL